MEFDNSKFSEIGKFNYVRERLEGEPKGHILGLPQTAKGYEEAKTILELTYGKDIKVLQALIKDFWKHCQTYQASQKQKRFMSFITSCLELWEL